MKLTDYMKVNALEAENIFIIDGPTGTKSIFAKNAADSLFTMISQADFMSKMSMDKVLTASSVGQNDKILIGVDGQVKAMLAKDAFFSFLDEFISPIGRNAVYRGKNMGIGPIPTKYRENIANNTYKNMFIGDGWSVALNDVLFRIGGFRYPLISSSGTPRSEVIFVGDRVMDASLEYSGNIVGTGYKGSIVRAHIINNYQQRISQLGENIIDPSAYAVYVDSLDPTTNKPITGGTSRCQGDILSAEMIYGNRPVGYDLNAFYAISCLQQLPIFALFPEFVFVPQNHSYWLQTLIGNCAATVIGSGRCTYNPTTNKYATRVWFPCYG